MQRCPVSLALSTALKRAAGRLTRAAGPRARSLSGFIGSLPPIGGGSSVSGLTQAQVEAFAGTYYYAELETAGILTVAEMLAEDWLTLGLDDRTLVEKLDAMAMAMRRNWYDADRRAQIFTHTLGFGTGDDFRQQLAALVTALDRYEQEARFGSVPYGPVVQVELAMNAILDGIARRGVPGLEQASRVLNHQLRMATEILGMTALHRRFNARDMWDFLRAVVTLEDGRTPEFSDIADRAEAGAAMLGWIAGRIADIRNKGGQIAPHLANDATLFRHAIRWQMAVSDDSRPTGAGAMVPGTPSQGGGVWGGGSGGFRGWA